MYVDAVQLSMAAKSDIGFDSGNMVIKDGLSRVFFHFKPPKMRSSSSKNGKANGSSSAVANGAAARQRLLQQRLRKTDHVRALCPCACDRAS